MSTRWWFPFDGMEEMLFKRAPDGYVYRAPNPWLFIGGQYYLLNEQQKTEVAARHRRNGRYLTMAMVVAIGAGVIIGSPWFDTHPIAMLLGAVMVGFAIGFAFNAYLAHAVRPILAGLEPTTQRITRRDALATQITVFSGQKILAFGLLSLALFALSVATPLVTSTGWNAMSIVGTVLFGATTLYWAAMYIAKRKRSVAC
jgi:hypothetical protein